MKNTSREKSVPVVTMQFKEPQRLPGSVSASSLTSCIGVKSRHTIDWLPDEQQFRVVYHPQGKPTEERWIFANSVLNYSRFPAGESYKIPAGSLAA